MSSDTPARKIKFLQGKIDYFTRRLEEVSKLPDDASVRMMRRELAALCWAIPILDDFVQGKFLRRRLVDSPSGSKSVSEEE